VNCLLEAVFRIDAFREKQRSAINLVLSGEDCLVMMATGAGKSICYQLPAMLPSRQGIVLVIQPLLSLVEDQLIQLARLQIPAASLNQHTKKDQVSSSY
jgi:superfamily II DNA helicase RecQ